MHRSVFIASFFAALVIFAHAHVHGNGNGHDDHDDHGEEDHDHSHGHGEGVVGGVHYGACVYEQPPAGPLREFCPDAVVNGISVECREYWMRQAMQVQFNGSAGGPNALCPTSFFGAVVVNHTDDHPENHHDSRGNNCGAKISQSSGKRGSLDDPSNHAEINATKVIANAYRGHGRDRSFWGQLTQYTTGESCSMCTGHQVFAGYKEVVYGVRVGDFIALGDGQIAQSSIEIVNKQHGFNPVNPTVYIRDVLRDTLFPYFAWRLDATAPCPAPCVASTGATRCVMP